MAKNLKPPSDWKSHTETGAPRGKRPTGQGSLNAAVNELNNRTTHAFDDLAAKTQAARRKIEARQQRGAK